jgi:hypothetical protein
MKDLYEDWLRSEIEAGRVSRDALNEDGTIKAEWLAHEWLGAPLPQIDPEYISEIQP